MAVWEEIAPKLLPSSFQAWDAAVWMTRPEWRQALLASGSIASPWSDTSQALRKDLLHK